jgi:hypothetical protein
MAGGPRFGATVRALPVPKESNVGFYLVMLAMLFEFGRPQMSPAAQSFRSRPSDVSLFIAAWLCIGFANRNEALAGPVFMAVGSIYNKTLGLMTFKK